MQADTVQSVSQVLNYRPTPVCSKGQRPTSLQDCNRLYLVQIHADGKLLHGAQVCVQSHL